MTCVRASPRFDGRLRVVAVAADTGHRVVFGAPGAPQADVPDAVAASCAVPGLSARRGSGDRDYAPVGPGTRVLCLVPTAAFLAGNRIAVRVLARSWQAAITVEAAGARRRGARVTIIGPDASSNATMGADLMDASRRDHEHRLERHRALPGHGCPGGGDHSRCGTGVAAPPTGS